MNECNEFLKYIVFMLSLYREWEKLSNDPNRSEKKKSVETTWDGINIFLNEET